GGAGCEVFRMKRKDPPYDLLAAAALIKQQMNEATAAAAIIKDIVENAGMPWATPDTSQDEMKSAESRKQLVERLLGPRMKSKFCLEKNVDRSTLYRWIKGKRGKDESQLDQTIRRKLAEFSNRKNRR